MKAIQAAFAVAAICLASNALANGGHVDMAMAEARFSFGDWNVASTIPASIKDDAEIVFKLKEYLKTKFGDTADNWPYAIVKSRGMAMVLQPETAEWLTIKFADFNQE